METFIYTINYNMFEILIGLGLIVAVLYISSTRNGIYGIPCLSLYQLSRHLLRNRHLFKDINSLLKSFHDEYGPTFCVHIKPFSPIVVTSEHQYFTQILASKEHITKPSFYDVLKSVLGECILISPVEIWKNDRKILNKAFEHESFKVFLECLNRRISELEDLVLRNMHGPIDMQEILHNFILDVIIESLKDPNISWNSSRTNEYGKASTSYKDFLFDNILAIMFKFDRFLKLSTTYKAGEKLVNKMRQFAKDLVDIHLNAENKSIDSNNVIYKMYEANIPYNRIIDNVLILIEGAHETTANTLSFLFYAVAKGPDVQDKICAELESIMGTDPTRTLTSLDLQQMKYTTSVVKEGLRLNTTVSFILRKLIIPAVVNDVTLPKGTNIMFNINGLQNSEKYFEAPSLFNPDRFGEDNKHNLVRNSWAPFSLGIRNCLGSSLAMQQVKLILAKMVWKFEFKSVLPEHKLDIKTVFVSRSMNGVPILATVRN